MLKHDNLKDQQMDDQEIADTNALGSIKFNEAREKANLNKIGNPVRLFRPEDLKKDFANFSI
jgi:hypothetical protein